MSSRSPDLPQAFLAAPIAHRGLHDRACGVIENSRSAIRAAVDAGYGIEIDVQMSACGEAMVFHDAVLDRLTAESGPLRARTAAELAAILLDATAEGIPHLSEILEIVGGRSPLLIEIKDQDGTLGPEVGRLETRIAGLLAGYAGPVAVMSFNPHAVAAFAEQAPLGVAWGLTTCGFAPRDWPHVPPDRLRALAALADLARIGAAFLSHDRSDLGNPAVRSAKADGLRILCWTVRSPAEEREARRIAENVTFERYLAEIAETGIGELIESQPGHPRPAGSGWRQKAARLPPQRSGH